MSSKIAICNNALSMLGVAPIRSFDEDNKRARSCSVMYDFMRQYLLVKFDWPFARKYTHLQVVTEIEGLELEIPTGYNAFQLPADCITPRDIAPFGSQDTWEVMGNVVLCETSKGDTVYLHYTRDESRATKFSKTFSLLLATALAVKLGPVLTQDKQLIKELKEQYKLETIEAWESDANIGRFNREYDNDPKNHKFVYPDGAIEITNDRL